MSPGDEDFALSLRYAPVTERVRLGAIFAVQSELRRIPQLVKEPPLGEIRLQWWREALNAAAEGCDERTHPAASAIAATGGLSETARQSFERLIDARARLFYEPEFQSADDLHTFLREAEAPLASIALGGVSAALERLGEAYALAKFAPALAAKFSVEAAALAQRMLEENRSAIAELSPSQFGGVAFLALTRGYARRVDGRPWPVGKRLALFKAILTGRI